MQPSLEAFLRHDLYRVAFVRNWVERIRVETGKRIESPSVRARETSDLCENRSVDRPEKMGVKKMGVTSLIFDIDRR